MELLVLLEGNANAAGIPHSGLPISKLLARTAGFWAQDRNKCGLRVFLSLI